MSLLSLRRPASPHAGGDPDTALNVLLVRMRQRFYPETLPALASCWLKTLCAGNHNRPWWMQLRDRIDRAMRGQHFEPLSRGVLISSRNWIERVALAGSDGPPRGQRIAPPFRSVPAERVTPYICRLLNEWLPAELAFLLTDETPEPYDEGIPALARAKALDRLLVRERLCPETLETFLNGDAHSPRLVYPADVEILQDVVLALLGRISAAPLKALPAELLGVTGDSALPPDYQDAVRLGFIERSKTGGEELHVPITDAAAIEILRHDAVRIGSVIVTMDGRAWQPWTLLRGDENRIVYRRGERLVMDCAADHTKLTVRWPETVSSWSGGPPPRGPFELFGREWRVASWEIDDDATLLHLTFSRILPIAESPASAAARNRLQPANVDMAWSELEGALAESMERNSGEPVEQMRRGELIPMGRALGALAECVQRNWILNAKSVEQHLRAARFHHASVAPVYGQAPWRILPERVQASLARTLLQPALVELVSEIFADPPLGYTQAKKAGREEHSTAPSQAA